MNRRLGIRSSRANHERARELAAERLSWPLDPADDAWLEGHLAVCRPCREVAAEYEAQRLSLRALRQERPQPPRDLWARTAAALDIEAERRAASARRRAAGPRFRLAGLALAPVGAFLVVALVVGTTLLSGLRPGPAETPGVSGPAATPIAVAAGDVLLVTRAADGSLRLSTGHYDAVCPVDEPVCGTSPSIDGREVGRLSPDSIVDAMLSPTEDRLVVVDRTVGGGGIYVYQVGPAATPRPSASEVPATEAPTPPSTEPPTPPPSNEPSPPPGSAEPTEEPSATVESTVAPSTEPSVQPTPSLEPTAEPPTATPEPTPTVAITPAPGDGITIASNVEIVGSVTAYSPDGTLFAFTARPADGSAGPDVYVWDTSQTEARAATTDHGSVFSSWLGDRLLVSRVRGDAPRTVLIDPATGEEQAVRGASVWRPSVSPGGNTAVWWDGTIREADDGAWWQPRRGRLVLGEWPADPSRSELQVLSDGQVGDWQVRWDEDGTLLAVWIAAPGETDGELSLYAVDEATGAADLDEPLLNRHPALGGFSLRPGRLAWATPGNGGTSVEVLDWSGDQPGQLRLSTQDGVTVVR